MNFVVKRLTSREQIFSDQQFCQQWQQLSEKVADWLFNSPTWHKLWCEQFFLPADKLSYLIVYDDTKLIGVAPFYIKNIGPLGLLRALYLTGQGEAEADEVASEYQDLVIHPDYLEEVLSILEHQFKQMSVDVMSVNKVLADSNITKFIKRLNLQTKTRENWRYLVDCQHYHTKKNTRKRINRTINALSRLDAETRWLSNQELTQYWQTMAAFHQSRWQKKNKQGVFSSEYFNHFHLQFINNNPEQVSASALFINNKPVAIHYYFKTESTLYFYQSGWDEERWAAISPGLFLHDWSIKNNPVSYYDFMMGAKQNSYKDRFEVTRLPMISQLAVINATKLFICKVLAKLTRRPLF